MFSARARARARAAGGGRRADERAGVADCGGAVDVQSCGWDWKYWGKLDWWLVPVGAGRLGRARGGANGAGLLVLWVGDDRVGQSTLVVLAM
jgi:hypothetical protein